MSKFLSLLSPSMLEDLNLQKAWMVAHHSYEVELLTFLWSQCFKHSYPCPTVVTEKQALAKLHHALNPSKPQLSFLQAKALWHQCQPSNGRYSRLFSDRVYQTYTLEQCYDLQVDLDWASPWPQRLYQEWKQNYENAQQSIGLQDPLVSPTTLIPSPSHLPKRLVIFSDAISPLLHKLTHQLKPNITIDLLDPLSLAKNKQATQALCYSSVEQELMAATQWLHHRPGRVLSYCYPSLPDDLSQAQRSHQKKVLSDYTSIKEKLLLTQPNTTLWPLSSHHLSQLLTSPRVLSGVETQVRHQLDIQFREHAQTHWSLQAILDLCQSLAPVWSKTLEEWHAISQKTLLSHCDPIDILTQQCQIWQHQDLKAPWLEQAWHTLIHESLQSLSLFNEQQCYTICYQQLLHLSQTIQPNSLASHHYWIGPFTPLIFLSSEQWLMGCSNQHIPIKPMFSPFLPHDVQQSIPWLQSSYQKKIAHTMVDANRSLRISYSHLDKELPCQPSPYCSTKILWETQPNQIERAIFTHYKQATSLQRHKEPAANAKPNHHSGSNLLELQIQCPFKAYIEKRLQLISFPKQQIGSSPQTFGQALHQALAYFWQATKDQATLLNMEETDYHKAIRASIDKALPQETTAVTQRLAKRLERRLHTWLEVEKSRPPFTVIATESTHVITLGGITYQLRIDRIDALAEGHYLIIDYKTGACQSQQWLQARPLSPQMPLYALCVENSVGISFAQTHAKSAGFNGISAHPLDTKGIKSLEQKEITWQDYQKLWRDQLTQVSEDFLSGVRLVAPHSDAACQYCDFKSLCRLHSIDHQPPEQAHSLSRQ